LTFLQTNAARNVYNIDSLDSKKDQKIDDHTKYCKNVIARWSFSMTHNPELIHRYHLEKCGLPKFIGEKIYVISALLVKESTNYHLELINSSFVMLAKLNDVYYMVRFA